MATLVVMRGLLPWHCHRITLARGFFCLQPPLGHHQQTASGRHPNLDLQSLRAIHQCSVLCAGHNKWSKVKNVKGPKDTIRSQIFMKLVMMIRVAVKEGGSNPELNPQLASLVEQCRSKNMPKATIEAAIKGAEKVKAGSSCTYEARGPGGSMLLIEVLTDNNTRTHQHIKHLVQKHGGMLCDGARHSFERKGVVVAAREGVSTERALELAIEAGAEDVQETQDEEERPLLQFICEASQMQDVRSALEALGLVTQSAALEYVACNHTLLLQEHLEAASRLLDSLNDNPDVVRVWDNIRVGD
ncbi:translational activator of cytochrome c oxidase 1 isoform X1 [Paramormyrops kingsleyae]|uniref:Translational activator of cytochrome c oxidase 1 n=1 Tax=Paramormyrops kingsleyae TaxID=1676925 RepID=A0A3B3RCZ7_9TELE|nr:translational activator of cytochrome c oxidase 1 isoform X1 [Paramormyrops kingsleyae]XP_023655619.1 translational activator of cytochrome c oxidase 1 isoform X1 [Paramormyrops kingsleyae]